MPKKSKNKTRKTKKMQGGHLMLFEQYNKIPNTYSNEYKEAAGRQQVKYGKLAPQNNIQNFNLYYQNNTVLTITGSTHMFKHLDTFVEYTTPPPAPALNWPAAPSGVPVRASQASDEYAAYYANEERTNPVPLYVANTQISRGYFNNTSTSNYFNLIRELFNKYQVAIADFTVPSQFVTTKFPASLQYLPQYYLTKPLPGNANDGIQITFNGFNLQYSGNATVNIISICRVKKWWVPVYNLPQEDADRMGHNEIWPNLTPNMNAYISTGAQPPPPPPPPAPPRGQGGPPPSGSQGRGASTATQGQGMWTRGVKFT